MSEESTRSRGLKYDDFIWGETLGKRVYSSLSASIKDQIFPGNFFSRNILCHKLCAL